MSAEWTAAGATVIMTVTSAVTAAAAIATAFIAYSASATWKSTLRHQRADKSVAMASELESAVGRCASAIRGKRKEEEIWSTYTDAWNYHRRFRAAYRVASLYHTLVENVPERAGKLLDRLREAARNVTAGGKPDETELSAIINELSNIVRELSTTFGRTLSWETR